MPTTSFNPVAQRVRWDKQPFQVGQLGKPCNQRPCRCPEGQEMDNCSEKRVSVGVVRSSSQSKLQRLRREEAQGVESGDRCQERKERGWRAFPAGLWLTGGSRCEGRGGPRALQVFNHTRLRSPGKRDVLRIPGMISLRPALTVFLKKS